MSLRTRVAVAAALGATVVVVLIGAVLVALLSRQQTTALDRRLEAVARVAAPAIILGEPPGLEGRLAAVVDAAFVAAVFEDGERVSSFSTGEVTVDLPALPPGTSTVETDAGSFRVRTEEVDDGVTVSVGLAERETGRAVTAIRRGAVLIGLLAVAVSAGLGWLFAGPAVRPLRELRDRAAASDGGIQADDLNAVRGAREAEELAAALAGLLTRVHTSAQETERALDAARTFAATAGHELRTPLTSMRTDLDVLRAHPDLPVAERAALLGDVASGQARLEATLSALSQLARGELVDPSSFGDVDLADLVSRAVADVRRVARADLDIAVRVPERDVIVRGWAGGLRLAVDNLLSNAVRHAHASRLELTLEEGADRVRVLVDDDGRGVPAAERAAVFERFVRGSTAVSGGSGLGLALVAQQAALHGGTAWLETSPLGGARAVLELARGRP